MCKQIVNNEMLTRIPCCDEPRAVVVMTTPFKRQQYQNKENPPQI